MIDPLLPALNTFSLTQEEEQAIAFALTQKKPWKHDSKELSSVAATLKTIKDKIRSFHMLRQNNKCCYCRMNLHGGGDFIVDREHIVPKDKFKPLTYVISNLSVACKRCNMQIKKAELDFLIDRTTILQNHTQAAQYLFIHPNFEKYSNFIQKRHIEEDDFTIIKYRKKDHPKAHYTYDYFKLKELELNSFDEAQGIETNNNSDMRDRLEEFIG